MTDDKNLQAELFSWANNTVDVYLKTAKEYDVAFYQQSPLDGISKSPDVVVMGINPGSAGKYSERKNPVSTPEDLLKGNREWVGHDGWAYVRNVKALLRPTFGDDVDYDNKLVFTNATFFATSKANELNGNVMKETLPHTISLVNILHPNIVICLSGQTLFQKIKHSEAGFIFEKVFDSKLLVGKLNDITLIGIYHTASWYTRPLKALVSKAIKLVNENREKSLEELVSLLKEQCHKEWEEVCNYKPTSSHRYEEAQAIKAVVKNCFEEATETKDTVTIPVNDYLKIVFVAQKSAQYIYCRHKDFNGKHLYGTTDGAYPKSEEISAILAKHGYERKPYALGWKSLTKISFTDNPEENAKRIIDEITSLIEQIKDNGTF